MKRLAVLLGLATVAAACEPSPADLTTPSASTSTIASKIVIVGFRSTPGAAATALIQNAGGSVRQRYKYIRAMSASVPAAQVDVLRANATVAYVDEDFSMVPLGTRQIVDWGVSKIDAPGAWALGFRGQNTKVGIFDSGIDVDHPDLAVVGGIDLVGDGNGLDDCNGHGTHVAGIVGARDGSRHTVGVAPSAQLYSMRFADCAWAGATLEKMIQGVEWAIDNGMDVVNMSFGFGVQGVSVPISPSDAAEAAFNEAYARGIVLVAASGNSSTPWVGYPAAYASVIAVGATDDADLIASFSQTGADQELTAPGVNNLASYLVGQGQSTTLTVPTDSDRELDAIALEFAGLTRKQGLTTDAVYANFGTAADYASANCAGKTAVVMRGGPTFAQKVEEAMNAGCVGVVIHNHSPGNFNGTLGAATTSDGRAWIPAVSITLNDGLYLKDQIAARPTRTSLLNVAGNLAILSGTSMASPHATGVAALVLSKNPALTPDQVRAILRASSVDLGPAGWDPVFGYGRVQARNAVVQTP
jgi:subtilisin family serine protease